MIYICVLASLSPPGHLAFLSCAITALVPLTNLATHPAQYVGETHVECRPSQLGVPRSPSLLGTTIDLHIALKPERENALIETLYEVSDPKLPKRVSLPLFCPLVPVLICTVLDTVHICTRAGR